MQELFLEICDRSIAASWIVLVVLVLRVFFAKAPKWIHVLLWGIVAVRLICPFTIESPVSLIPDSHVVLDNVLSVKDIGTEKAITASSMDSYSYTDKGALVSSDKGYHLIAIFTAIWVIGVWGLLVYTMIRYYHLYQQIDTAVLLKDSIYQSENVDSPFVAGVIRPRIYIPFTVQGQDLQYVLAHEQAHIRRKDHWWKPLGYALLILHWFNPLVWLAYVLLCRDIEQACDEMVIQDMGNSQRADYSQTLLSLSIRQKMITACPLSFGEIGVKERVRSVLQYQKPTVDRIVLSVCACIVVAVCFLTSPVAKAEGSKENVVSLSFEEEGINMIMPNSWKGQYAVEQNEQSYTVYNPQIRESLNEAYDNPSGGVFFTVVCYEKAMTEQQYEESEWNVAAYDYLFATDNHTYVVLYATDVQYDAEDKEQEMLYQQLASDMGAIAFQIR